MKTIILEGTEYALIPTKRNIVTQKRRDLEWGELIEGTNWHDAMRDSLKSIDGWRLPTFGELYKAYEKKVPGFGSGLHWSSTEYLETRARLVNFSDGSAYNNDKSISYSVRLVRDLI